MKFEKHCALIFLLSLTLISSPSFAQDEINSEKLQNSDNQPTLDRLNEQNPEIYPKSVYELQEVKTKDENTITKYNFDDDGSLVEKFFKVVLKKTKYGKENDASTKKYFHWENNKYDNKVLTEVKDYTEEKYKDETIIEYKYDNNSKEAITVNSGEETYKEGINGNFIEKSKSEDKSGTAEVPGNVKGGAIDNSGTIGDIFGSFVGNNAENTNTKGSSYGLGGAIYNNKEGEIGNITGDFIGNYTSGFEAHGGAIHNEHGNIDNITGDFIGNYTSGTYFTYGGAIYNNYGEIGNITGDFIGNYVTSTSFKAKGGGISNWYGKIGDITGNFINNYATSDFTSGHGGAIYNYYGTIGKIKGDFIGNYGNASNAGNNAQAGGINNMFGSIEEIDGDFIGNYAKNTKGSALGGAICNTGTIGKITANFIKNFSIGGQSSQGGVIDNEGGTIGKITGDFIENFSLSENGDSAGGVITNFEGTIDDITGNFINNYSSGKKVAQGGAIYNDEASTIGEKSEDGNVTGGLINASFVNNHAVTSSSEEDASAQGGAIWTNNDLNVIADKGVSLFKGNYVQKGENQEKDYQAIWVEGKDTQLNLEAKNEGKIVFEDKINGTQGYKINIKGDRNSDVILNNNIEGQAKITLDGTNLHLGKDSVLNSNELTLNTGLLSMANNTVGISSLKNLSFVNETDFVGDVDLENQTMDRLTTENFDGSGKLNVVGLNIIKDTTKENVAVLFAEENFKNQVENKILNNTLPNKYQGVYSPIYMYAVEYDKDYAQNNPQNKSLQDGGYFVFTRGDKIFSGDNEFKAYNPAVLSSSVEAQANNAMMTQTMKFAFEHADAFSKLPMHIKMSKLNESKYKNKYAILDNGGLHNGHNFQFEQLEKHAWVRPFTAFENIDLKNGPKTNAILYGTIVGIDSDIHSLKNDWYNVHSAYMGYMGADIGYTGVSTNVNGGLLGFTETLYKNNFFTALTLTAGADNAISNTMYGSENNTSILSGIASKTGYNFEYLDGKYIVQPSFMINYMFSKTFDYKNAANININSSTFHTIQLYPQIRLIANLKKGWQPYISAGVVFSPLSTGRITANNVLLPKMTTRTYAEYGLGLQKIWKDRFTGFIQAMVHNGGRNGVAITAGFTWELGKDPKKDNL